MESAPNQSPEELSEFLNPLEKQRILQWVQEVYIPQSSVMGGNCMERPSADSVIEMLSGDKPVKREEWEKMKGQFGYPPDIKSLSTS
jgi:hypothetical protein